MTMTLLEIQTFVRTHLDLTSDDLPDSVLNTFIREGFTRGLRSQQRWPFHETSVSFNTVAGTQTYALSTISSTLEDIVSIEGIHRPLRRIDHDEAEQRYPTSAATTGEPDFYSVGAGSLYLWPKPNSVYALAIRGYRKPTDWTTLGASSTPDAPYDFHEPIAFWALSRAYAQQDDLFNASQYAQDFDREIAIVRARYIHAPIDRPIVLNGGRKRGRLPGRLRYPFDE